VEVVDPAGAPLPQGIQGEIRLSGERVARTYVGAPKESAAAFRDGGFYPGDLGRLLPGDLLVIDGRVDDRMNLGGFKFLPGPLDEEALSCPGVVDAAAFAAPDADGLDECWLAVVRGEGFERGRLVDQLARHGNGFPTVRFAWTEEIPRNAMGKVDRRRLRDETLAVLGLPGAQPTV
jgi:long-chain acyl-CoA synthetase